MDDGLAAVRAAPTGVVLCTVNWVTGVRVAAGDTPTAAVSTPAVTAPTLSAPAATATTERRTRRPAPRLPGWVLPPGRTGATMDGGPAGPTDTSSGRGMPGPKPRRSGTGPPLFAEGVQGRHQGGGRGRRGQRAQPLDGQPLDVQGVPALGTGQRVRQRAVAHVGPQRAVREGRTPARRGRGSGPDGGSCRPPDRRQAGRGHRPAQTPCLGARVSRPRGRHAAGRRARPRAGAHADLSRVPEAGLCERLTIERLRAR